MPASRNKPSEHAARRPAPSAEITALAAELSLEADCTATVIPLKR
jgi:hypothetical protein